jgi:CHAT domain-containing protein/tetratricopeptide (TPR) repeat protein
LALLAGGLAGGCRRKPHGIVPAGEILALRPRSSQEHEIRGGETRSFGLKLAGGTFVLLEISQRGLDLSSRVFDPDGDEIAAGEGAGDSSYQLLALTAEHQGLYVLAVDAHGLPKLSERYRITVLSVRPVVSGDEKRVSAARALTEGRRLAAKQSPKAMGRLVASLSLWKAAGEIRGELAALESMAVVESGRGNNQAALDLYRQAFERSRESRFAAGEARSLSSMGFCKAELGLSGEAVDLKRRALEVCRRTGGPYEQALALESLGTALLHKSDPESALPVFLEAQSLALKSGSLVRQARILSGLGASQQLLSGHQSEAQETLEKGLMLSRSVGDPVSQTAIENNLAALYQARGQLQKAVEMYTRKLAEPGGRAEGALYLNLGSLYIELGDLDRALKSYDHAKKIYHESGRRDGEVAALIGIGSTRQRMRQLDQALGAFEEARKAASEESWQVLHYLGLGQYAAGRPAEALPNLERALQTAQDSHNSMNEGATRLALGSVYRVLGNLDAAAEQFGKSIDLGIALEIPNIVAPALLQRAMLRRDEGRLEAARDDIERALALIESTRRNIAGQQLRTSFFATRRGFYEFYIDLLLRLDGFHPKKGYQALALAASERARARGLLDLIAEGRIDVRQGLTPDLRRQEDQLSDELSKDQSELRKIDLSAERAKELRADFARLDTRREQLEWQIREQNPRYAGVRSPRILDMTEIRSQVLDDRTAFIEFALGEKGSTLFVVTRRTLSTYPLPPASLIAGQVLQLRKGLEQESRLTRRDYLDAAFQLYQSLLAPAAQALAGKQRLLIAPDGALYYIPFEALLTEPAQGDYPDLPYLLRRYSISYVPSASVLASLREPRQEPLPTSPKKLVAFAPFPGSANGTVARRAAPGDAAGADGDRWNRQPLPASKQEILELARLYPGESLSFLGDDANEGTVKHNPAVVHTHRLHFATHAQLDERYPEYSALVLTRGAGEDGLLQVHEIFRLRLSADLVVLSACQTALGKEVTGEGLIGLTRAFFYAGVPSLVVSLWNVADGPTPDLMLDFYKDLDRLNDKGVALRNAKLSMIKRGKYAHPSYWAPFILIGEPR